MPVMSTASCCVALRVGEGSQAVDRKPSARRLIRV